MIYDFFSQDTREDDSRVGRLSDVLDCNKGFRGV